MTRGHRRPVWAEIDVDALRANAATMAEVVAPSRLCAVVKANGYGHGAVTAARAFLDGGASWLAVALVEEGIELRRAGIDAAVLLLSEPAAGGMEDAVVHHLTPTLYTEEGIETLARAAARLGDGRSPVPVHVKIDTGMHRVGSPPQRARALADLVRANPVLELSGVWTHLAVADETANPYTRRQLDDFDAAVTCEGGVGDTGLLVHAANSAGALAYPEARYSMVRCGLALYGYAPVGGEGEGGAAGPAFRPVLSLKARVSFVRTLDAGERLSYGLAYEVPEKATVATVPLGYADGVPRRFGTAGGCVLIGGRRCRVAGNVTMDQLMVDCGPDAPVVPGDEVVLIGTQGDESVTATEWAQWLGVIPYEVLCGIGNRVPRVPVAAGS